MAPEHLVDQNCSLARWIYDEIVFFPVVQIGVLVACVALQTRNSCELLKSIFKIGEPLKPQDADGATEDLGRVEWDSAFDDPVFQVQLFTLLEHTYNSFCI